MSWQRSRKSTSTHSSNQEISSCAVSIPLRYSAPTLSHQMAVLYDTKLYFLKGKKKRQQCLGVAVLLHILLWWAIKNVLKAFLIGSHGTKQLGSWPSGQTPDLRPLQPAISASLECIVRRLPPPAITHQHLKLRRNVKKRCAAHIPWFNWSDVKKTAASLL